MDFVQIILVFSYILLYIVLEPIFKFVNDYQDLIGSMIGVFGSIYIMNKTLISQAKHDRKLAKKQAENDRKNTFDAEEYLEKYKALNETLSLITNVDMYFGSLSDEESEIKSMIKSETTNEKDIQYLHDLMNEFEEPQKEIEKAVNICICYNFDNNKFFNDDKNEYTLMGLISRICTRIANIQSMLFSVEIFIKSDKNIEKLKLIDDQEKNIIKHLNELESLSKNIEITNQECQKIINNSIEIRKHLRKTNEI